MQKELIIRYTNHRGENSLRRILPVALRFGTSPWHPSECWLLRAIDLEKEEEREFDLRKIERPSPTIIPANAMKDRFQEVSDAEMEKLMRMQPGSVMKAAREPSPFQRDLQELVDCFVPQNAITQDNAWGLTIPPGQLREKIEVIIKKLEEENSR